MPRLIRAAVLCALIPCGAPLAAQRALSLGIGGGAAIPTASVDGGGAGWHALATVGLALPMLLMGLRLDAAHQRVDAGGERSLTSGTLNLTYRLPTPGTPVSPYLIAGAGGYHGGCGGAAGCSGGTRFGWNAGLGTHVRVLGLRTFAEARYHGVRLPGTGARMVPLTLGVTF